MLDFMLRISRGLQQRNMGGNLVTIDTLARQGFVSLSWYPGHSCFTVKCQVQPLCSTVQGHWCVCAGVYMCVCVRTLLAQRESGYIDVVPVL